MALEDLKERLQTEFKSLWERVQESSLFIRTRERYENLTPTGQKLALFGTAAVFLYILMSIPLGHFSSSSESVTTFEDKRQLIRDMMKVSREIQDAPQIPVPPDVNSFKTQIDSQIRMAQLLPEQIRSVEVASEKVNSIPANLLQGVVRVSLAQLNLRQVIDLGFQFQNVSPSIKMTDLQMDANAKDPRYFDVTYKLAVLSVPNQAPETAEEPPPPPPKKKKGK